LTTLVGWVRIESVTIEQFLSFWSQHNTAIIEGLIALVIILSLFLGYRSFFAKKGQEASSSSGQGLDTAQLEKTLQKILENQSASGASAAPRSARGTGAEEDLGMDVDLDEMEKSGFAAGSVEAAGGAAESAAEVAQLRVTLNESQQKIEVLQKQLKEAQAKAAEAPAPAAGGGEAAASGLSAQEKEELGGKIRDLEARLAEYEIISEDIADLSRYREENEQLRKELEALKAGGGVAAAPAAAAPSQEPPVAEPIPAPTPSVEPAAAPATPAETSGGDIPVPTPEAAESPSSDLIDDELMREFAAAVEGQKALDKAAEKAGDGSQAAKTEGDDAEKLMNEFENFVSKKG